MAQALHIFNTYPMGGAVINPDCRHSGVGRNPAIKNMLRSRQNPDVVPLTWGFVNRLDSGLRRNDAIRANGQCGINDNPLLLSVNSVFSDETTSHSTKLAKDASQVVGYVANCFL